MLARLSSTEVPQIHTVSGDASKAWHSINLWAKYKQKVFLTVQTHGRNMGEIKLLTVQTHGQKYGQNMGEICAKSAFDSPRSWKKYGGI